MSTASGNAGGGRGEELPGTSAGSRPSASSSSSSSFSGASDRDRSSSWNLTLEGLQLQSHKIYLAVNVPATFQTIRKKFLDRDRADYVYNSATIPIQMSVMDRRMYPMISEALKESGSQSLELLFNPPQEGWADWEDVGLGRYLRNRNGHRELRLRVKESPFLKRLWEEHRSDIVLKLDGRVYRPMFRRGRQFPVSANNEDKMLELEVDREGATVEISTGTGILPELLDGDQPPKGRFTLELHWNGPEVFLDRFPIYKKLLEEAPKDAKIVLEDGGTYECHSILLKAASPVFSAMLECNMIEGQTKEIEMVDLDAPVLQTFLSFLNNGSIPEAFQSSEVCFKLFVLANKYVISVLEQATKNLLEVKPDNWMDTGTALELICFVEGLPKNAGKLLHDKAKRIIQSRQEELPGLKRFQELIQENHKFAETILK